MTRKTFADYALWAALPMAHTSRVERRIKMVLDSSRRRTLPHRFLLLAVTAGATALIPLSMLQPIVKAQAVSEVQKLPSEASVQIVGVRDINIYHTDPRWWRADGLRLAGAEPHLTLSRRYQKDLFSSTNVKNLLFAFHLPVVHSGDDVTFAPNGSQIALRQPAQPSVWDLAVTFPLAQKTTNIKVGVAIRPWIIVAAHAPVRSGDARVSSADGDIVFSPIQRYPKNNWLLSINVSQPRQDRSKQDWRIVAVDAQGRKLYPLSSGPSGPLTHLHFAAYFDRSVSPHRIRQFQLETRPFVWTEFKNVALELTKP